MVTTAKSFAAAVRAVVQLGGLVVIDEFQRLLDRDGRPFGSWADSLTKFAKRNADGGALWLVSNREVGPMWAEPFLIVPFGAPNTDEAAVAIVLDAVGGANRATRFPPERRSEVVHRLGWNPRALRLLGHLLRTRALDELLGPTEHVEEGPEDPKLVEGLERQLLNKAREGLSAGAAGLLRDGVVLREDAPQGLLQAMCTGALHPLTQELRDRYLVERPAGRFRFHPVVREVEGPRLRLDERAWRSAHLRAGRWYGEPLLAERVREDRIVSNLSAARYHLSEAGEVEQLQAVVRSVSGYIERQYGWDAPKCLTNSEQDARIALLSAYLEEDGAAAVEFQLAKALKERGRAGDAEQALRHAKLATTGQDHAHPWVLWIKLVLEVHGLEAAAEAARVAAQAVDPAKNLYSAYQLWGYCLNHLGRASEAVDVLLQGVERCDTMESRLADEAAFVAASATPDVLRSVRTALRTSDACRMSSPYAMSCFWKRTRSGSRPPNSPGPGGLCMGDTCT